MPSTRALRHCASRSAVTLPVFSNASISMRPQGPLLSARRADPVDVAVHDVVCLLNARPPKSLHECRIFSKDIRMPRRHDSPPPRLGILHRDHVQHWHLVLLNHPVRHHRAFYSPDVQAYPHAERFGAGDRVACIGFQSYSPGAGHDVRHPTEKIPCTVSMLRVTGFPPCCETGVRNRFDICGQRPVPTRTDGRAGHQLRADVVPPRQILSQETRDDSSYGSVHEVRGIVSAARALVLCNLWIEGREDVCGRFSQASREKRLSVPEPFPSRPSPRSPCTLSNMLGPSIPMQCPIPGTMKSRTATPPVSFRHRAPPPRCCSN